MIKLYSYPRSSASFRVRIALHMKGIPFEIESVDLLTDGQKSPDYLALNPQGVVPTLVDGEVVISQSLAAIEYLEDKYPEPSLLPSEAKARAQARQLALVIACEVHPLQNLGVLRSLTERFAATEEDRRAWARDVIERGLQAFSRMLDRVSPGLYCHGGRAGLADLFLIPQLFNARRFGCDLRPFPRLVDIDARCMALEAFRKAAPPPSQ